MLERKSSTSFLACAVAFLCTSLLVSSAPAQKKAIDNRTPAAHKKVTAKKGKKKGSAKQAKKENFPPSDDNKPSLVIIKNTDAEEHKPSLVIINKKDSPPPDDNKPSLVIVNEKAAPPAAQEEPPWPAAQQTEPPTLAVDKPSWSAGEKKEAPPVAKATASEKEKPGGPVTPGRYFLAPRGGAEMLLGTWGGRTAGPLPVFYGGGILGVMLLDGPLWYDVGVGAALAGSPVKKWPGISAAHNDNLLLRHLEFDLVQTFNIRVAQSKFYFSLEWDLGVVWTLEPMFSTRMLGGVTYLIGKNVTLTAHVVGFRLVRDRHFVWQLNGAATQLMLSLRFG